MTEEFKVSMAHFYTAYSNFTIMYFFMTKYIRKQKKQKYARKYQDDISVVKILLVNKKHQEMAMLRISDFLYMYFSSYNEMCIITSN